MDQSKYKGWDIVQEGTDPHQAESLAAIRRHIDAQGGVQAGPNPVSPTGPVPEIRATQPSVMPTTTNLAEKVLTNPFAAKGGAQQEGASSLARTIVPQTLGDVGMLAGQMSLPVLRALPIVGRAVAKLPGFIGRIIMGAVGDAAGEKIAGRSAMAGAAEGAAGGAVGESAVGVGKSVGRGVAKVAGKIPVLGHALAENRAAKDATAKAAVALKKAAIDAADAEVVAANRELTKAKAGAAEASALAYKRQSMENRAHIMATSAQAWEAQAIAESKAKAAQLGSQLETATLGTLKAQTGSELSDLGTYRLQNRIDLGKTMERTLKEAEGMVGADTKFTMPSMAENNPEFARAAGIALKDTKEPHLSPSIIKALEENYGPQKLDQFTLREISQKLTDVGNASRYPTDVSTGAVIKKAGLPAREQIKSIMGDLETALKDVPQGPDAFATMRAGRHAFSVGNEMLAVLQQDGAFNRSESGSLVELKDLQRLMQGHLSKLRFRMADDEFKALRETVYPSGNVAARATTTIAGRQAETRAAQGAVTTATEATTSARGAALAAHAAVPPAQANVTAAETARDKLIPPVADRSSWPFTPSELGQIYLDSATERTISEFKLLPTLEMTNMYDPSQAPPAPETPAAPPTLAPAP